MLDRSPEFVSSRRGRWVNTTIREAGDTGSFAGCTPRSPEERGRQRGDEIYCYRERHSFTAFGSNLPFVGFLGPRNGLCQKKSELENYIITSCPVYCEIPLFWHVLCKERAAWDYANKTDFKGSSSDFRSRHWEPATILRDKSKVKMVASTQTTGSKYLSCLTDSPNPRSISILADDPNNWHTPSRASNSSRLFCPKAKP